MLKQVAAAGAICVLVLTGVISVAYAASNIQKNYAEEASPYDFSIIQITDTQYLSMYPEQFNALTNWIVDNAQQYNVKMVIHTGDIVEDGEDTDQWSVANEAIRQLLTNNIPYCWCAGNHDQIPFDDFDGTCLAGQYQAFDVTELRQKTYWVSDIFDAKNTAVKFTFDNYQFLLIEGENGGNSSVIAWMRNLIETNPYANVIVGTHDYIDDQGPTTSWGYEFRAVLNQYPNVFMVVCGHNFGIETNSYHVQVGNRTDIFWNRQEDDYGSGANSVRIYEFSLENKRVDAFTNQIWNSTWLTGDNEFSLSFTPIKPPTQTLSVALDLDRARYTKWSYVNMVVSVTDSSTNHPVSSATVAVTVQDTHGRVAWTTSGFTNGAGQVKVTFGLVFDAQMGTYTVTAQAAASGYETKSVQASFFSAG